MSEEFDADEFVMPSVRAHDKDGDTIVKENAYPEIPPGLHVFQIHSFVGKPELNNHHVTVDGRERSWPGLSIGVRLCLADNPRATITDYFVTLAKDTDEYREAYLYGMQLNPKPTSRPGFEASKFANFFGCLQFEGYEPGKPLPESALRVGNWKAFPDGTPRTFLANVKKGTGTYEIKKGPNAGQVREKENQIALFSYKPNLSMAAASPAKLGKAPMEALKSKPKSAAEIDLDDI